MITKLIHQFKNGSPVLAALMTANILNFAFNAYLARSLSLSSYGFVALLNTFWTILLVGSGALTQLTSYQVARSSNDAAGHTSAYLVSRQVTRLLATALMMGWIIISPLVQTFFHAPSLLPILIFAPMIWLGLLTGTHRGYVQGRLRFSQFGGLFLLESAAKLVLAVAFVKAGFSALAYLSLPLSVLIAWGAAVIAVKRLLPTAAKPIVKRSAFPWTFLGANLTTGLAAMAFLSVDLLLAKHYLSNTEAGRYAMLSLIGKMIYFVGSLLNSFILPLLGAAEAQATSARRVFWRMYAFSAALAVGGFVVLGPLGHLFVPVLFGDGSKPIVSDLVPYSAGILFFTLSNTNVMYHLAKKHYLFPALSLASAALMAIQIVLGHGSIPAIAHAVFISGLVSFITITGVDLITSQGRRTTKRLRGLTKKLFTRSIPAPEADTLRILVFNWRDTRHGQAGGAEVFIQELAKRWHAAGHDVTLFCGNDGNSKRHETISGVHVIRRGSFYLTYAWAFVYYAFRFRSRSDVIIDCHNGIPFFTPLYAKQPIYCVVHHVHQEVFARYLPKPLAAVAKFLEAKVMPWVYRDCYYVTVSQSSKQAMIDQLGIRADRIQIVHNGIDPNELKPGKKTVRPTVLYLGRLKPYKSVDVLVKAFAQVATRRPDAQLVVGGTGEAMEDLKGLTAKLKIASKVKFLGYVPEPRKIRLMQQAWVFVNPSYAEGWGITTIEANACGTPVIASDVPGLRDSVKSPETGRLVPYGDVAAFATSILHVIDDNELRLTMSVSAKAWSDTFDWQASADVFLEQIGGIS